MWKFRVVYFFLFGMYAIGVPYFQLLLDLLGYSPAQIGFLLGAFELAGVSGPFLMGTIADRTGRFRLLIVVSASLAVAALVPILRHPPFALAMVFTAVLGFAFKTNVPLVDTMAGHLLPDPDHDYGRVRMWGSVAFAVVVVAVAKTGLINLTSVPSIAANLVIAVGLFLASSFVFPRTIRHESTRYTGKIQQSPDTVSPWLYVTVGIVFLMNFGFAAYTSFFTLYLVNEVGLHDVSILWAIGAASEIPVILLSGKLIRRFGPVSMLAAAGVSMIVRLVLYAGVPNVWVIAPAQMLHAVSFGVMHTASVAIVRILTPSHRRAFGQALYNGIGMGLALFTGASLGGIIAEHFGYRIMYLWAVVPVVAGLALLLFVATPLRKAVHTGIR